MSTFKDAPPRPRLIARQAYALRREDGTFLKNLNPLETGPQDVARLFKGGYLNAELSWDWELCGWTAVEMP